MAGRITLTMIKPGAFSRGKTGLILAMIENAGFKIKAMKLVQLRKCDAEVFYAVHEGKPFFEALVEFMSSGPIVVAMLEKENAVEDFRKLIGSTDPLKAAAGTIRHDYGVTVRENAVHGSDCDDNAAAESTFFFSNMEMICEH